jgi:pimeloyl-ACP methyl ester carboxylesterase
MPYFTYQGHHLFYREQGDGPLMLILPGNTASSACHQGDVDYFGTRYHAVSLDFLGTGRSDRQAAWPTDWWAQGAHQAGALIEHLGYEDAIVTGASGGAIVALLMAIHHPNYVRAVIADSLVERFTPEMLQANVIEDRAQRTPGQVQFWTFAHGEDWEQVIEADTDVIRRLVEDDGGAWLEGRLGQIRCPVLLTASLGDTMLPGVAHQVTGMAQQIETCYAFFTNSGDHPMMWTQPQAFRCAADSFLKNLAERITL